MNISKRHFLMLASISIFTGIIAPSIGNGDTSYPYALTNMQYVAYAILFGLTLLFILAFFQFKRLGYLLTATLIILLLSLGVLSITGMVKNFSGEILQYFSWGWLFLIIGGSFLLLSFQEEKHIKKKSDTNDLVLWYEKIIGIVGIIIFVVLSTFVVLIAEKNAEKNIKNGILGTIFSEGITYKNNSIISPAFSSISHFHYNRINNKISFIATDASGKAILYPDNIHIEDTENIAGIYHFNDRIFFLHHDGSIIENGKKIGDTNMKEGEIDNFLAFYGTDNALHLVNDMASEIFHTQTNSPSLFFFDTQTKDFYWRERIGEKDQIFKNGQAISDPYHSILRYTITSDGGVFMIAEGKDGQKIVVKNNTTIHTIHSEYVQGTMRMNASNVLYAIKNLDDESFSLVVNGVTLERKLDEIREIFIEQNSSGFAYFGKPQGETKYCLFTRYRGNLCGLQSYMNPSLSADNSTVIFAGFREGNWSIYQNTTQSIRNAGYKARKDISHDYFFFDQTNFRHYIFIEKGKNGYKINKMGHIDDTIWEDVDINSIVFGYNNFFIIVKDIDGWKIMEF